MPPKPPLTHFLCLPLHNTSSHGPLSKSLATFIFKTAHARTLENPDGVPEGAVRPVGTLHLTLGVMSLTTPDRVESASTLLKSLSISNLLSTSRSDNSKPTNPGTAKTPEIAKDAISFLDQVKIQFAGQPWVYDNFMDIAKDFASKKINTPQVLDRVFELFADYPYLLQGFNTFLPPGYRKEDNPENDLTTRIRTPSPLTITLRGLQTTSSDPTKTTVLYAPPVPSPELTSFCEKLRAPFLEAGLIIPDSRPLLLHATILNTIYVKSKAGSSRGGGKGSYARKQGKVTIDATEILDEFEDFTWVEDMRVEKVAICKMGAKRVEDESIGQEYEQETWVEMP